MNILQKFEAKQLDKARTVKEVPDFAPGDTVKVNVRIKEGTRERIQAYEGVCISRAGSGINESFTVRKISYGEGVERVFPLWSSVIDSVELVRRGSVRRAKLYYLRDLRGKKARIVERTTGAGFENEIEAEETAAKAVSKTEKNKAKKEAKSASRTSNKAKVEEGKKAKTEAKKAAKAAKKAEAAAGEAPKAE